MACEQLASIEALPNGLQNHSGRVAEDVWSHAKRIVQVGVAIHVVQACALGTLEEQRDGLSAEPEVAAGAAG